MSATLMEQLAEEMASAARAHRALSNIRGHRQRYRYQQMENYNDPQEMAKLDKEFIAAVLRVLDEPNKPHAFKVELLGPVAH